MNKLKINIIRSFYCDSIAESDELSNSFHVFQNLVDDERAVISNLKEFELSFDEENRRGN